MKNTRAYKSHKETRSLLPRRYVLEYIPFKTPWRLSCWFYYTVISSAYFFSYAKRTSPLQCHAISVACGQYPVARGLGDMTSWLVRQRLMKPHKWRSINLCASYRVPHCTFCSHMFCYHLRMKPIGFTEKGPRRKGGASLNLHGLSISFIPWTNLGVTWLFILSWINVPNQGVA